MTESPSIILGTFDAESIWRDSHLAQLPFFPDHERRLLILAMDELLFSLCQSQDYWITRFPIDDAFRSYLKVLGYEMNHYAVVPIEQMAYHVERSTCLFEELLEPHILDDLQPTMLDHARCVPYAIMPQTARVWETYQLKGRLPDYERVRKVNSKVYSHQLRRRLSFKHDGTIIRSVRELEMVGERFSRDSFLIKDPYGVSGKGNLLIQSNRMLQRVIAYIQKQEQAGKKVTFLLEPYHNKVRDFSCHMVIEEQGDIRLLGIQEIINQQFNYMGSRSMSDLEIEALAQQGYIEQMFMVAKALYEDGYFGYLGIDSMELTNGEIIPIVEINARQSMGLLNHALDQKLRQWGKQGSILFISLGYTERLDISKVLTELDDRKLLYEPDKDQGIIPLTSNLLTIHYDVISQQRHKGMSVPSLYKGRWYMSVVAQDIEEKKRLVQEVSTLFEEWGCKIFS
ncbi:hypothetical protein [Thermoflavimicrobium daqui]|uniref:ATP-grasp domain-containing protein n=1 Tax=Thermoflavimicrobium daqui TaxID=2137476 RepID=A0A364K1C5_9BACL|nr:hypothetical protein [Thermoflavimicrobium daqui]RAL21415.1 hypothetical protein DL897_16340 [Thermoflavimicrobium daqui]